MASAGIRKTPSGRYKVWWRLDDDSQGAKTFDTRDQARKFKHDLLSRIARGTWTDPRLGKTPFETWALEWWETWSADSDRSPTTLATTEGRLRRHVLSFFGPRELRAITPSLVRRWQTGLRARLAHDTVMACRSVLYRILQAAEDDGLVDANPVRKVRAPEQPVDPDQVFGEAKRRAYTPEEAGQVLAHFPRHWRDHVICLLGTGLRFGEFAGLSASRVHLDRQPPVVQVVNVAYYAGRFGRGIKNRPKSAASVREVPLPRQAAAAIRRQLPTHPGPGAALASPLALVFAGPGGANGVPRGARSELWRRNFERTYHRAIAKLTDPAAASLRPSAARVAKSLRAAGPATAAELAARLATSGRALRPATIQTALEELEAAGLAVSSPAVPGPEGPPAAACWAAVTPPRNPVLDDLELHGPHDFRHTYATWLEDAGIPSRVIDELMGHAQSGRTRGERGSVVGRRYRHTTPEMAARAVAAIEARLEVVLAVAARLLPESDIPDNRARGPDGTAQAELR
ncbi:MAG TPA: tyrosine-type recombinase/integrase [Actinomycetota bacterium]|nr:tyrosine-type recombinase/integrase [Actinomycetota bacterium]